MSNDDNRTDKEVFDDLLKPMPDKCPACQGDGWTTEHDGGAYSHDEDGNCLGYCPVQVMCEKCNGTGKAIGEKQ